MVKEGPGGFGRGGFGRGGGRGGFGGGRGRGGGRGGFGGGGRFEPQGPPSEVIGNPIDKKNAIHNSLP